MALRLRLCFLLVLERLESSVLSCGGWSLALAEQTRQTASRAVLVSDHPASFNFLFSPSSPAKSLQSSRIVAAFSWVLLAIFIPLFIAHGCLHALVIIWSRAFIAQPACQTD
jgi:hypothetical protein